MKIWFLKLHRWIALGFALPLIVVIVTGLLLSFEPWLVVRSIEPGTLTAAKVDDLLRQHDADGKARSLVYRAYDKTLTIASGRSGGVVVDTASGQAQPGPSALAETLGTVRRLHEKFLIDAEWLVISSTAAMLVLIVIGLLMGLPRFSNTLSGWHKGIAWVGLPLIVLSPLTGIFIASGLTFAGPPPAAITEAGKPPKLIDAVRIVGERHDLSALVWLRPRGDLLLARIVEDGEYRVYAVTKDGTTAMPRNLPRLWHEGQLCRRVVGGDERPRISGDDHALGDRPVDVVDPAATAPRTASQIAQRESHAPKTNPAEAGFC
jgi:hypothetical protein